MNKTVNSLRTLGFKPITINRKQIKTQEIKEIKLKEGIGDNYLFLLLHGWTNQAENLRSLAEMILEQDLFQDATIVIPELPLRWFSRAKPEIIARDIVLLIDNLTANESFENIYFIGHSTGALLARKVYLLAYGEIDNNFENNLFNYDKKKDFYQLKTHRKWSNKVNRIILLAGLNRGWSRPLYFNLFLFLGTDFLITLDTLFSGITRHFVIFQTRENSSFLTNLRIQWMALSNLMKREQKDVLIIQLLGTIDDIVSPQDNIDFVNGNNFCYLQVPKTGHKNIIELDDHKDRKAKIKAALISTSEQMRKSCLSVYDLEDESFPFPKARNEITDVIFIIHGIRDKGFWTKKIGITIKHLGKEAGKNWATETSTYGFFGFLPFLMSYLRQNKVQWLMDEYITNKALYPQARFHYFGHSHGTYLLAKALEDYPWCQFDHIAFAGSVVTKNYDWEEKIDRRQVKKILNFVATNDWVVGIFPNLLGKLPFWRYFGGAGHEGFSFDKDQSQSKKNEGFKYETNKNKTIHQLKYITGDHGAALTEENWEMIANFIVKGIIDLNLIKNIKVTQKIIQNNYSKIKET